ncbi:uncharacterized protein LOC142569812 [Dermacentor variabilis]|uniref:uncharacterized protein LOC142569812 n=1 Tax=Dermacentor variabilis TaxID=34621 RepID=UPI003F5BF901
MEDPRRLLASHWSRGRNSESATTYGDVWKEPQPVMSREASSMLLTAVASGVAADSSCTSACRSTIHSSVLHIDQALPHHNPAARRGWSNTVLLFPTGAEDRPWVQLRYCVEEGLAKVWSACFEVLRRAQRPMAVTRTARVSGPMDPALDTRLSTPRQCFRDAP